MNPEVATSNGSLQPTRTRLRNNVLSLSCDALPLANDHSPDQHVTNLKVQVANGEHRTKCRNLKVDILFLSIVVLFVIIQFALFDYYFVQYGHHTSDKYIADTGDKLDFNCPNVQNVSAKLQNSRSYKYVYYFLAPDLLAILAMATLPVIQFVHRKNSRARCKDVCRHALANIRYSGISWFIYAFVFNSKIIVSAYGFMPILPYLDNCAKELTGRSLTLGVNVFLIMLCGVVVIFLFLVISHHAHTSEAKEILHAISEVVTFDILDGVHFLEIVFSWDEIQFLFKHPRIQECILALVCLNLWLPTISLMKMFDRLSLEPDDIRKALLHGYIYEDIYVALFLFLVNVPYLVIRCYLWYGMELEMSVFVLKNAIMIIIQVRQIFIYSRRIYRLQCGNAIYKFPSGHHYSSKGKTHHDSVEASPS